MQMTPILKLEAQHIEVLKEVKLKWQRDGRVDWICTSVDFVTVGTPFQRAGEEITTAIKVAIQSHAFLTDWAQLQFPRSQWDVDQSIKDIIRVNSAKELMRMAWVDRMLDLGFIA